MEIKSIADLKKIAQWAKRHRISRLAVNGIEIEFHEKAFTSDRAAKKVYQSLVSTSKGEPEEEFRKTLFHSA